MKERLGKKNLSAPDNGQMEVTDYTRWITHMTEMGMRTALQLVGSPTNTQEQTRPWNGCDDKGQKAPNLDKGTKRQTNRCFEVFHPCSQYSTIKAANTINSCLSVEDNAPLLAGTRAETKFTFADWTVHNIVWEDYGEFATSSKGGMTTTYTRDTETSATIVRYTNEDTKTIRTDIKRYHMRL